MGNGGDAGGIFPAGADQGEVPRYLPSSLNLPSVTERNRPSYSAFDQKEPVGTGSYGGGLGILVSAPGSCKAGNVGLVACGALWLAV